MSSSSSSSSKVCFNSECTNLKPERPRKGWRLHSGDCAELCDRCASTYEEGRFCETFHSNIAGWRNCESCGKRVHCGCIISAHVYVLLDPGGVQCLPCARKNIFVAPNTAWPPSLIFQIPLSERLKEPSTKNWSQLAGSGPVPWRQAPSLFSSSIHQPETLQRGRFDADISAGVDRFNANERFPPSLLEKKTNEDFPERFMNGSLKFGVPEIYENGKTGIKHEEQPTSCVNMSQKSSLLKDDPSTPQFGVPYTSANETNGQIGVSGPHLRPTLPSSLAKQLHGNLHSGAESFAETQTRNGRPRGDTRGRNQLLPRYWPRITDQELQQISGDSNSVITPLFEKMLSASDAGRIGRLVLPKKCAEAYFPPISQPEGLPLKVQDAKGKEWIFQFRFWPNNNSRMYVLEGVTPCIQAMQLQAGDIVTFSRLEPEGKLVMGFRKASSTPSDQDNETARSGNGVTTNGDVEFADPGSWSKVDKSGYIAKEALGAKSSGPRKRKNNALSLKSKRLRIDNEDLIELKLTWEEAQGLLRPPPNHIPTVVVIEGFEFEEYEDAPVLGKPTIIGADSTGEKVQWAQCEDCFKWRKLPTNALLPPRWTCSDNSWDPERSLCSAPQELTSEQLEDLLPSCSSAASKKMKASKEDLDNVEVLEGLDTLANLAILGEGEATPASQATTKHPRHRPGCSCIVCIQPPSGKGPKHKQTCTCNVCLTVKRRFRTLMMRREKKQSEKDAETTRKKQQQSLEEDPMVGSSSSGPNPEKRVSEGPNDDLNNNVKSSPTPFKAQIDLNIQPEREEELSPRSDPGSAMKLLNDGTEKDLKQQNLSTSIDNGSSSQAQQGEFSSSVVAPVTNMDEDQTTVTAPPVEVPGSPSAAAG